LQYPREKLRHGAEPKLLYYNTLPDMCYLWYNGTCLVHAFVPLYLHTPYSFISLWYTGTRNHDPPYMCARVRARARVRVYVPLFQVPL